MPKDEYGHADLVGGTDTDLHSHAGRVAYTERDDVEAWDFVRGDLIADEEWQELDFSGIIPPEGANQLVHLRAEIEAKVAEKKIIFTKFGQINEINAVKLLTQNPHMPYSSDFFVGMDANRKIQYKLDREGVVDTDPYARWHLDESAGAVAADSSGWGRNGTLINMEDADWVPGQLNNCLQFDGTDEYVDCGWIANWGRFTDFSFEFSFKTSSAIDQVILSKQDGAPKRKGWVVRIENGMIYFQLVNSIGTNYIGVYTFNTALADGEWHHCIITYDGSSFSSGINIYIDSTNQPLWVELDNLTAAMESGENCQISGRAGANDCFNGQLDEISIYNLKLPNLDDDWLAVNMLVRGWFEQN